MVAGSKINKGKNLEISTEKNCYLYRFDFVQCNQI